MLHKQTFEFLKWIEEFNDKRFFDLYKPLYLQIKQDFDNLISFLIKGISKFDINIWWLEAKNCTFRIYKDMRFARNRVNPYKTNLWANIAMEWKKSEWAWYYIHIENNKSFLCLWIYNPSTNNANIIREKIYNNRDEFKKIITNKKFKNTFWDVVSYKGELKKTPKGFDTNHPSIKYLKYKDRLIEKKIKNNEIFSNEFWEKIIEYSKIWKKLNDFLN